VKRGDLVTVAMPGDFGKPRPALVIQGDPFSEIGTVAVLLLSGTLIDAPLLRPTIQPTSENGLRKPSQIMIDKIVAVRREKLGPAFGRLEEEALLSVTRRSLAVFLGLA
jgi:mRNA interferase MazF